MSSSAEKLNAAYAIKFQKVRVVGLKVKDTESANIPMIAIAAVLRLLTQRKKHAHTSIKNTIKPTSP